MSALLLKADIPPSPGNVSFVPSAVEDLGRNSRSACAAPRRLCQLQGSCLLQAQYSKCLLRPADCLSQGDFRPAETHRNPGGDQLQHELAGVTTIIRQVIGKLVTDTLWICAVPSLTTATCIPF